MTGQGVPTMPAMDGYHIAEEPMAHLMESEMAPLFTEYFDELSVHHPALSRLDVAASAAVYREMEANKALFWVSLRHGPTLAGFAAMLVMRHHQLGYRLAQSDLLYIAPGHRGHGLVSHLIGFTEQAARERGCQIVSWGVKSGTSAARLFAQQGYLAQDVYYAKEL